MKRLGIILLVVIVIVGAFWIGLMLNFPGESVSRFVERQVNGRQTFDLVLSPAELRWNRLTVARAELKRRDNPAAAPLFVVTDFAIPITWRLFRGLPASGSFGQASRVEAFLPWYAGGEARLDGSVDLASLPLPEVLKPIAVTGRLDVRGRFKMDAEAQAGTRLPDGTLELTVQELVVNGIKAAGVSLPPTRLDAVNALLETGRTINLRRFEFRGDLQGSADGTFTPNLRDPRNSLLSFKLTSAFRDTWMEQLGDLRPILQGFLNRGRVELSLTGTVGNPQLQPVRGAN
jgi:type II secretion system protein N